MNVRARGEEGMENKQAACWYDYATDGLLNGSPQMRQSHGLLASFLFRTFLAGGLFCGLLSFVED